VEILQGEQAHGAGLINDHNPSVRFFINNLKADLSHLPLMIFLPW
jgi:hypothetical protein